MNLVNSNCIDQYGQYINTYSSAAQNKRYSYGHDRRQHCLDKLGGSCYVTGLFSI